MHALKDILYDSHLIEVRGKTDIAIKGIGFDSRAISKGMLFVAVKGTESDGHDFITEAIGNGAIAVICEKLPAKLDEKVTWVLVEDSSLVLGEVARIFYEDPSLNMQLVGVTGTNGKTSLVTLLYDLFAVLGYKTGLLSTVKNCIGDKEIKATHTTPDVITLNVLLKQMVDEGCEFCFMEVSSHAIDQNRIAGIHFKGMVFTNLTHDHLDYHKTFDAYLKAKKRVFDDLEKSAFALVNIDDKHGAVMVQNTRAHRYDYSLQKQSDFKAKILESSINGLFLDLAGEEFYTRLIGKFNAYNLLAAYAVAYLLGENKLEILTQLSKLESAEGRFNHFVSEKEGIVAIVDYAHTPDALKNVLETINNLRKGIEKVYTVVGCGGNRDKAKRPMMADIACEYSDQVILTSDNPRDEDPEQIIADMKKGLKPNYVSKVLSITNRQEAIRTACTMAHKEDIVLVAGKGHEKYQEVKGEKFPFDDKAELVNNFKILAK